MSDDACSRKFWHRDTLLSLGLVVSLIFLKHKLSPPSASCPWEPCTGPGIGDGSGPEAQALEPRSGSKQPVRGNVSNRPGLVQAAPCELLARGPALPRESRTLLPAGGDEVSELKVPP